MTWRSALYPDNWTPGSTALADWSYAGYRAGEHPLPDKVLPIIDIGPPSGGDDTMRIQQAIVDLARNAGGTVQLSAGEYRIQPQTTSLWPQPRQYGVPGERNVYSLWIPGSNVVLRGAGSDKTRLLNTSYEMRGRHMIYVRPDMQQGWADVFWPIAGSDSLVTADLKRGTTRIPVQEPGKFAIGQWVAIGCDLTAEFIKQWDMADIWRPATFGKMSGQGTTHYAKIRGIDGNTLVIDLPIMFGQLLRDKPRVWRCQPHLSGVGIEHLSIGMAESPLPATGRSDYDIAGTGAWHADGSSAIHMNFAVNSWVRDVSTYQPEGNVTAHAGDGQYYQRNSHILSNGIQLFNTRGVTVENCRMERAMFRGGGGNGYLYDIKGAHSLIKNCVAVDGRHNYTVALIYAVGNVITGCKSIQHKGSHCDTHRGLTSYTLWDEMLLEGDAIVMHWGQGQTSTEGTIWNLCCDRAHWYYQPPYADQPVAADSRQIGMGYVIGTSGLVPEVEYLTTDVSVGHPSAPADWVEGIGNGATLEPQSLWAAQLRRRIKPTPTPTPPPPATVVERIASLEQRMAAVEQRLQGG